MGRLTWPQRRQRLRELLDIPSDQDVDEDGEAWLLDDLLWGSARPNNTAEYSKLCFGERDLEPLGMIARGQFGLVEAVKCKIDERLYARKSIDRKAALRSREQCHPQVERDILLLARQLQSEWVPHLLSAFQTPDKLVFVMSYYDGGSLWDIVEALGEGTPVPESDLSWWMPQAVCAIEWCHSHGIAHRDIKPHNFVFDSSKRLRLVDFGSAARMLPAGRDGIQLVPKRQCIVPCGTCDYIAPEILNAHEEALIEIETETQEDTKTYDPSVGGYGKEIDWWSFGAMLYELAFGFPPFYAKDIRKTYTRIVDHNNNLTFPTPSPVSPACTDLMKRLLCHHEQRLGRRKSQPVRSHEFFKKTRWATLHRERAPQSLRLPQFSSIPPPPPPLSPDHTFSDDDSTREAQTTRPEQPFDFSALFQSTMMSGVGGRGKSLNSSSVHPELLQQQRPPSTASTAFIGFSWGPATEAFTQRAPAGPATPAFINAGATPGPNRRVAHTDPPHASAAFFTPMRGNNSTVVVNTVPRSALRRGMSDREALRQMVGCVTVSARKRVLQTGRTPRLQVLRGVAFRNSDDGSMKGDMRRVEDAGTETEDEHLLPPSPSPSPRPSSRLSGRMGMLSDSTGSGGIGRRQGSGSGSGLMGDSSSGSGMGLRATVTMPSPNLTNGTAALEQTATMTMTGSVIEPPTREQSVFLPDASPPRRVPQQRAPQQPLPPRSVPQPQPQPQPKPKTQPKPRHQTSQRIDELSEKEAELNRRMAGMSERHAALLGRISDLEQRLRQASTVTGE